MSPTLRGDRHRPTRTCWLPRSWRVRMPSSAIRTPVLAAAVERAGVDIMPSGPRRRTHRRADPEYRADPRRCPGRLGSRCPGPDERGSYRGWRRWPRPIEDGTSWPSSILPRCSSTLSPRAVVDAPWVPPSSSLGPVADPPHRRSTQAGTGTRVHDLRRAGPTKVWWGRTAPLPSPERSGARRSRGSVCRTPRKVIHRLRASFMPDRLLGGFAVLAGGTATPR